MEYEEEMEEDAPVPLAQQPSFDTTRPKTGQPSEGATKSNSSNNNNNTTAVRYRECLKNHAVGIGGHATDGCGEFMPSGDEGTMDALKCAACSCHRNFHRKEIEGEIMYPPPSHASAPAAAALPAHHHNYQFSPYYRAPPPTGYLHITPSGAPQQQQQPRPLALPAASGGTAGGREDEDISNPSSSGGGGSGVIRKRFRTKFTPEQKERMFEFAERLGWRIQKHDEAAVEQFCAENGVQRHVLKVWMHNNKHTLGKKNPN